jgi:ribokinase
MGKTIVVVGSINIDLVASVQRLPAPGETVLGHDFSTYPGGKGANQAVGAARLGGEVVMVGRLGNDVFADQLKDSLEAEGVLTDCVERVPGPSGSAVILVSAEGANSIVVIPGANNSLQPEDLRAYADYLSRASIILAQLEIPVPTVEALAKLASEYRVPFMLDPAPACELSRALLRNVTWLTPNESETQALLHYLGIETSEDDSPALAAQHLLETGVRNVILKMGARGIFIAGEDVTFTHIPPIKVEPIDTTAAGDAFNGGFAFALSNGMMPIDAARFANAVAALSITRAGAQPSMPTWDEVEVLLNSMADPARK